MKRLTVHLKNVKKKSEEIIVEGQKKTKSKIYNTLSFMVEEEEDANRIIANLNENKKPRNNVKSWYLSNIR
tara:strand:+ start:226 stop:438 length:213 start_codon:yes stop_codon:yes gene_type:complete